MSAGHFHNEQGRRDLLPDAIGSGLKDWLRRCNGVILFAGASLGWLSLLAWELPTSGQHTGAGGVVTHFLGRAPIATADFLLQGLGLATALVFTVPTFWSIEQLWRQPLSRPLLRLLMWLTSVLAFPGTLSALPSPSNWPFARGLGGLVGDQLFTLARLPLAAFNPTWANLVVGLTLMTSTLVLFVAAVGVSVHRKIKPTVDDFRQKADISLDVPTAPTFAGAGGDGDQTTLDTASAGATPHPDEESEQAWQQDEASSVRLAVPRDGHAPAFRRSSEEGGEIPTRPLRPIHVPYDDMPEDTESRLMAERFAPQSARTDELGDQSASAPQAWFGWKDLLGRAGDAVSSSAQASTKPKRPLSPGKIEFELSGDRLPYASPKSTVKVSLEPTGPYRLPPISLLSRLPARSPRSDSENTELMAAAQRLEVVLGDFGVRCQILGATPGPNVTQFEIRIPSGTKTSRVVGLAEDIARSMGLNSMRVAPVPGRATLIIELPNARSEPIALRDLLESKPYRQTLHAMPLPIGIAVDRQAIVTDLASVPGLLMVGNPGSGKSQMLRSLISSLMLKFSPTDLRILLVDARDGQMSAFEGAGHLAAPVIHETAHARRALQWCVTEMDERLKTMSRLGLRGLGVYNNAVRNALRQGTSFKRSVQTGFDPQTGRAIFEEEEISPQSLPFVLVAIDDLDELLATGGEAIRNELLRLAHGGRNAGIHLIATARQLDSPATRQIVATLFPSRLGFKMETRADSRIAIGQNGAETLQDRGDFLFSVGGTPIRGQAPTLVDGDIVKVVEWINRQVRPRHEAALAMVPIPSSVQSPAQQDTELYQRAVSLALQRGGTTASELRAKLGIGATVADSLVTQMMAAGLLDAASATDGLHPVLLGRATFAQIGA